jgi:putative DNA primase/helicase
MLKGGLKKGSFFKIEAMDVTPFENAVILCEGYATGASIHLATGAAVAAAIDAGNLLPVAKAIRQANPETPLIFAADNDRAKRQGDAGFDEGFKKAAEAAIAIGGATVAMPETPGQDFNDLATVQGQEAVLRALRDNAQTIRPRTAQDDHATGRNVSMTDATPPGTCPPPEEPETCDDWREFSGTVPFTEAAGPEIDPNLAPDFLRDFCLAVAEDLQVPFELPLVGALGALSVACQRKFEVYVKEGFTEPVNLYLICPLEPGERKSATLKITKRPLQEWELEQRAILEPEKQQAESRAKSLQKTADQKRTEASKEGDEKLRERLFQEAADLEAQKPDIPVLPRLLVDDVTMERFAEIAWEQGERIGVIEAEGGIFDTMAGRYQNGVPNLDFPLKGFSGDPVHIDRKGQESIAMNGPAITFCLCPQPAVMRSLREKPMFLERGLIGRFLFWLPRSRVGSRKMDSDATPRRLVGQYDTILKRLLAMESPLSDNGTPRANLLNLAPEAMCLWRNFAGDLEHCMKRGGEFEYMRDWAGRLHGQAIRLAALFHLSEHSENPTAPIEADTMERALKLTAALSEHAKAAYGYMGCDGPTELAKEILDWIKEEGGKFKKNEGIRVFTARDALNRFRGRSGMNMEQIEPALEILAERGFINPVPIVHKKKGRPKSPTYGCAPGIFLKNNN